MAHSTSFYLPEGLPIPAPAHDDISGRFWNGLREDLVRVQRNPRTGVYQWPAQWICHDDQGFDVDWVEVAPKGVIYSWTRVWHPVHPVLSEHGPYIVVIVEMPHAGNIRMLGNLLGDPAQTVPIGAAVEGVFEHHEDCQPPYTLLQWRLTN
jgi:uncharacterized OB-fold protein